MSRASIRTTETEGEQRQSERHSLEGSMSDSPMSGSIPEERPYTIPPTVLQQRNSPLKSTSTASLGEGVPPPLQFPPRPSRTLPQPTTPITITRALYLLATGKLVQIPDILSNATLDELFNHFKEELVVDQDWARTLAGLDYAHYGYSYIINEEALHFACHAYNMIHSDHPVSIPDHYQHPEIYLPPITYTPEPMEDEPPIPLQRAAVPDYAGVALSYAYPRGYGLPGTQGLSRLFAVAITGDEAGPLDQPQPPSKLPPPGGPPQPPVIPVVPLRWAPPRYLSPPKLPDPPTPWVLAADDQGPWAALKPNMVKEPENFNGDSNDIARFFSQCDMYFSVFNQYFQHHPHKVIFCASCFSKDAQIWWELCARELGRNTYGDQVYPAYEQFVEEVRQQFWKDANAEIKFTQ